jgi:hypothetical protein
MVYFEVNYVITANAIAFMFMGAGMAVLLSLFYLTYLKAVK